MSKQTYICSVCATEKQKYASQVVGKNFYCSPACRYSGMRIHQVGIQNPNFKHGLHCEDSFCDCGLIKDYRAKVCRVCRSGLETRVPLYFCFGTPKRNATLWRYIKTLDLIPWKTCLNCGQGWEWNGQSLSLHLDHIDGDTRNNHLDNLRVLCPNCHTQTPTYAAKNRRRK